MKADNCCSYLQKNCANIPASFFPGRRMKNIWIHSIVLILLSAILIAVTKTLVAPAMNVLAELFPAPDVAMRHLFMPVTAFSLLAPGLLSGWFSRRHPLLIGAAAGGVAAWLANDISPMSAESYSFPGDVLASGMVVAVATLAGRALRYRFRPVEIEISRTA